MTWGAVAIAGATLGSAYLSSSSASDATGAASDAAEAQLNFERERYADWKDTYGTVENNLSSYFSTITPEFYAAQGLENFEKEKNVALDRVRENFAQRGIADSGLAAATEIDFATSGAESRAKIRSEAPSVAREEQLRFLQVGLGLSPGSAYSSALSGEANRLSGEASAANLAAGEATSSAVKSVGTALADYFDRPVAQTTTQAPTAPADDGGGGGILDSITGLFSDARLKTNLKLLRTLPSGLNWYSWDWVEDGPVEQATEGVIAQDVQAIFPEAVSERDGFLTVDYSRIN